MSSDTHLGMKRIPKFDSRGSLPGLTYNEEDYILEYLEKAKWLMDTGVNDYEIVLINDVSADKSY